MCNVLSRINCCWVFLLGVIWLMSPLPAVAETWPIKEFKVFQKKPGDLVGSQVISDEMAREIERWLKRVSQEYESMGFRKPNYTDIASSILNNKKVLPVYVYPFSTGGPAAMLSPCAWNEAGEVVEVDTYMTVDSGRNIKNGKLTPTAYRHLAHELFHAVQNSYDLFIGNCKAPPGDWMAEGTAEAIGIEMARKIQGELEKGNCQMGIRRYARELYVRKQGTFYDQCGDRSYYTQSFWQFLGEYITGEHVKKNLEPEIFVEPNFRYLHRFFSISHSMGTRSKDLAWLNTVLQQNKGRHSFGISLHAAYSKFVGTFSSYWEHARQQIYPPLEILETPSNLDTDKEGNWMELIYSKCHEVVVSMDATIPPSTVPIEPIAARCLKVNFDFSGQVKLTFFASDLNNQIELTSLAISTDSGKQILPRNNLVTPKDGKIGKFPVISAKKGIPQYFIISNVRRKTPGKTAAITPTIIIEPEMITTDMIKEKKKDPDSGSDSPEKKERKAAEESRSWTGQAFQEQRGPCKKPFEANPCGPTTEMSLLLVPDTSHLAETLAQPSMPLERKYRLFNDVVKEGSETFVSDMVDDYLAIHQQDGGAVDIIIPQIQPGFTGTISNAHIGVSKAIDAKGSYRALGPWVGSCRNGYRPSTGIVTIKEFTKYTLRGTFSAQLVDTSTLKSCQSGSVVKPDGGPFRITEIDWNLDIEIPITPKPTDEAIIDQTVEDFNEFLPGLITDDLKEAAKERAKLKRQEQKQSKQEKAAKRKKDSVFQQCRCGCEMENNFCAANPGATCCVSCEPLFKLCKGNPKSHAIPLTAEEHAKEDAEVQAMRQRYEAYVDSLALPNEAIKQQMMKAFNDLNTVDEKKLFMMAIPE